MTNKQLIITGVVVAAAVGAYFYWQKHKATVVPPNPTQQPGTVTAPASATAPATGSTGTDWATVGGDAWSALSGIWDKYQSSGSNP